MENREKNAAELFDSPEKWNAFLELSKLSSSIQDYWWKKLCIAMMTEFGKKSDKFSEWKVVFDNESGFPSWIDWRLYDLSDDKRIAFYFDKNQIGFYTWSDDKILNDKDFLTIKKQFTQTEKFHHNLVLACEEIKLIFEDTRIDNKSQENLAWYAGNKTEKFAQQGLERICQFLTPENAKLFKILAEKYT